jgi:hypothetical protein
MMLLQIATAVLQPLKVRVRPEEDEALARRCILKISKMISLQP